MTESRGPLRVALTTLGCKVNYAEMAELAGTLAAAGCEVVTDDEPADVRVVNSCTVTLEADATTRQRLGRLRRADPTAHLVVTGCSVDGNPDRYLGHHADGTTRAAFGVDAVFSNADKLRIADHILQLARRLGTPEAPVRAAPTRARAFLKVQDGCDHRCTYCAVWRARGASRSTAVADILERAHAAVAAGHGELVLTGVDLGSYGKDVGSSLAGLLRVLLDAVGPGARVRLSSVNTNDITADLLELNGHPRLCSHWHMPLQSGSDPVLKAMHRGYRRRQYLRVCEQLRTRDADTEFTTDVMVGFPGETDQDHQQTLALLDEVAMLQCHAFRFSARPDTPAAEITPPVADAVARRRSAEVRRTAARNREVRMGRTLHRRAEVVWDRVENGEAHGLTSGYLEVVTQSAPATRPGALTTVTIDSVEHEHLRGRLVA